MILRSKPGARVASVATAFPEQLVDRELAARTICELFPQYEPELVRGLVERSGVETRHIVPSMLEVLRGDDFTARNDRYKEAATGLGVAAARRALEQARIAPEEVDVLIDVSCTGLSIPALDVPLVGALGLRRNVRRLPIAEAGCAAGALAMGLAGSFAELDQTVLIVSVELCSLTMCQGDHSKSNLVASVLFGDGAAAAVVSPGATTGPRIQAVGTHLIPDSLGAMGFDYGTHGMRLVLQRELPGLLADVLPSAVAGFLAAHDRSLDDVGLHVVHPGGRKILEAYERLFELGDGGLRYSREALRRYGNLSSASILSVLELALADGARPAEGKEALLIAVGPGLTLEMSLLDFSTTGPAPEGGER